MKPRRALWGSLLALFAGTSVLGASVSWCRLLVVLPPVRRRQPH